MKRKTICLCIVLVILTLVFCLPLCACGQRESESLRICLDVGNERDMQDGGSLQQAAAKSLAEAISVEAKLQGHDLGEIELEVIPSGNQNRSERASALQRIRTEIMTGAGPDVFICATENTLENSLSAQQEGGRLFPYVSKAVEEGMFLPLDDYMDRFELVSREELVEPVLEGGKDSQGQTMVVPLCYSIPCMLWDQAQVNSGDYVKKEWADVLENQDNVLSEQIRWVWPIGTFSANAASRDSHASGIPYIYPGLFNYSDKTIDMDEDELIALLQQSILILQQNAVKEQNAPNWALFFSRFLNLNGMLSASNDLAVVPLRNEQGGATAVVSMYCAVNANTQRANDAAFVVEYLLTEKYQESGALFTISNAFSMPSMLLNKNAEAQGDTQHTVATEASWDAACQELNYVYFPSPADWELDSMLTEIQEEMRMNYNSEARLDEFFYGTISEERLKEIVHEYYGKMIRLLEES